MLELERMKKLNEKALVIQRVLRGLKYRSAFIHIDPAPVLWPRPRPLAPP